MKTMERKFSGLITGQMIWIPTFVSIGSNILGRKFQKDSAVFTDGELLGFFERNGPEAGKKLQQWLLELQPCFVENNNG